MVTLSPKLGDFLIKVTQSTDLEIALNKVIREYLFLKLKALNEELDKFEAKWNMPFDEFIEKSSKGEIDLDIFSYDVERDFWAWEKAETLKKHYESIRSQWM